MRRVLALGWLAAALLPACSDPPAPPPVDPPPPPPHEVLARTDAATADECPHGGTVVRSGPDRNDDGVLGDDEVEATTPVCQDAPVTEPAPVVRVRLDDEPAGPNCDHGGTAVRSGVDANRNDVLDEDEITHTDYVCDDTLLTRMEDEAAGEHCVGGGLAFQVGRDDNGDGFLDPDEIEWTDYQCTDVLSRTVEIHTAADVALLQRIRVITGALVVLETGLDEISLPSLEMVGGRLAIGSNDSLRTVSLPALGAVDGHLGIMGNDQLRALELPQLQRVEGDLYVAGNPQLSSLALDRLSRVGRDLILENNERLTSAPAHLSWIEGDITVARNPQLGAVRLWLYDRAGTIAVTDNASLASLSISMRDFWCSSCAAPLGAIRVTGNAALATLDVTAGFLDGLYAAGNDALTDATIRARVLGDLTVNGARLRKLWLESWNLDDRSRIDGTLSVVGPVEQLLATTFGGGAVVGGLVVDGTRLTGLNRTIAYVNGRLTLRHNALLQQAEFLEATGDIRIEDNDALTWFWIYQQETLHGDVDIIGNAVLPTVAGIQHTRAIEGSLTIIDNPALVRPAMYGLQTLGGNLRYSGLPALQSLDLYSLETIGGYLSVVDTGLHAWEGLDRLTSAGAVSIGANPTLEDIALPALRYAGDSLQVYDNPGLRRLGLGALQSVHSAYVSDNRALPVCAIQVLFARLGTDGSRYQSGNDDAGVCPAP